MATKRCSKCGEVKDEGLFSKGQYWCKACVAEYNKANQEKNNARKAEYRKANREKTRAREAKYREANREKLRARQAEYRKTNREKAGARHAKYREANREKLRARQAEYREANHEKLAENQKALVPSYVAKLLSIPVANLTPDLLALKQEQLKLERALRKLKKELQS